MLDTVRGVSIPLLGLPVQDRQPFPFKLSEEEREAMSGEVGKLLEKGAIEWAFPEPGQFVSNVFLRPKPNGEFRLILDLTELNKYVPYEHFKMTSLHTALDMVRKGCWMGSVDLKDAYYSVNVAEGYRKLLRFEWEGVLYQFVGMPNGLACAPRIFTKLLSPVFAQLREEGVECFPYIDDSFVVADNREECRQGLQKLCQQLDSLGLVVHLGKSVLEPTQELIFLGFIIDSVELKVKPTEEKKEKLERAAQQVLARQQITIREFAGLIGLMVAYSAGVQYGRAHYRYLEIDRNRALEMNKGNFDAYMVVSDKAKSEIAWWLESIGDGEKKIRITAPEIEICTDASTEGWGAHRGSLAVGGRWKEGEMESHINVLELKAILFGLKSLCPDKDAYVSVLTDNTTALAYVKNMGGVKSPECNEVAKEIWSWCEEQENWVSIAHIPGVLNVVADFKSRNFQDNIEWELKPKLFDLVCRVFGTPEVDLFASRLNNKLGKYVSWGPDPGAWRVDAFSFEWTNAFFYLFPPFSVVGRVLQKLREDQPQAVLVVPDWPTQPWYGALKTLSRRKIKIRRKKGNLINRGSPENFEVMHKSPLVIFHLWGKSC